MSDLRLIHSTFESRENAKTLAEQIVENRLAACVNLGGFVESIYVWEGSPHREEEVPFTAKTTVDRLPDALDFLREHHPYDCPELLVTPVERASDDYENWAKEQTETID
jgi:periplasmic divalent cation tolerance protein